MREWLWNGGVDYSKPWYDDETDEEICCCEKCGAEIYETEKEACNGLCEKCYAETEEFENSLTVDNALKGYNETVELPDFLTYIYDEEQIKDILLANFRELDNAKDLIRDYALEDVVDWAERKDK